MEIERYLDAHLEEDTQCVYGTSPLVWDPELDDAQRLHFVVVSPPTNDVEEPSTPTARTPRVCMLCARSLYGLGFKSAIRYVRQTVTPSAGGHLSSYKYEQGHSRHPIFDGRHDAGSYMNVTGPPVGMFHWCFDQFSYDMEHGVVSDDTMVATAEFVHASSAIYSDEYTRTQSVSEALHKVINLPLFKMTNDDQTSPDVYYHDWNGRRVLGLLYERKNEIGAEGLAPDVQGSLSFRRWLAEKSVSNIAWVCWYVLIL